MNKKTRKLFTWCLVVCMVVVQMLFANVAFAATPYAGADRYQTALKVVQAGWTTSDNAVIARGDDLADALAAAPLAYAKGKAPILLTETGALPTGVMEELTALGVKNVYIVGGTGAVSQAVETALAAKFTVKRLWGADRAATSLAVAKEAFGTTATKAVMVNGEAYADALSISSIAANLGMPILLVSKDTASADVIAYLTGKTVYAVGGEGVISAAVASNATRLSGADRYATNVAVLKNFTLDYSKVYVAVGEDANCVDALGGAALAAKGNNPMVLVDKALTTAASDLLKANVTKDSKVFTLGGVVPASVATAVEALVPVVTDLKVDSVSAINAKQLVVKFTLPVKESTIISNTTTGALVANTVTVGRTVADTLNANKNVTAVTGSLSTDGLTLTLTASAATFFSGTYTLTIADSVETADAKALVAYAGTVTASDAVAPVVSTVAYSTITGNITITTSEPLTAVPTVLRINGAPVTGLAVVANSNNTKFSVAKPSTVAVGTTATVYVAGAADYAGNLLTAYNGSVAITDDQSTLQVVSATQEDSNVTAITLNKSIASNDATLDANITALIDGAAVAAGDVTFALDTTDTTHKTILATFANTYTAPSYFYGTASSKPITFVFVNNAIVDVFGQKLAATTQTVTMTKDLTGPKAISAAVSADGSSIEITFDEVLGSVTAGASNVNVTFRKDGIATAMGGANAAVTIIADENGDNTILSVSPDTTAELDAGTYTVRLAAGTVDDTHTNDCDVVSVSTAVDPTTTSLKATFANLAATNNQFQVTYTEAVDSSALNRSNYTLDGVVLPDGTDIYFHDSTKTKVNIVLPSGSVNFGAVGGATSANNALLGVMNVKTTAGKVVVTNAGTVKVEDNTAAVLQSATLVGANILKLTFNENVSTVTFTNVADMLDDLSISNGTATFAAGDATQVTSISGKDVIITITPGTSNWAAATTGTVTVKTLAGDGDVKDADGVVVKANVSVTLTK